MAEISTSSAPRPGGHYAQAVERDGIVYVSGQLPVRADGTHQPDAPFTEQVRTALSNLRAILEAAGVEDGGIVRTTAYIVGVANWPAFNEAYAEFFGEERPARTVVPVSELHYGYLIEIDAIAHLTPS
ncbi:MAG TPA: RidA family protein [Tianweitania sediminis]|jgi:reactive intermediate/imine deaminase|nr:RidA family protein [Tianweitania sediminis]